MVTTLEDFPTPALVADLGSFRRNLETMSHALPGARLRPHIKAFKSTAVAGRLVGAGHQAFCCATIREMEGMARAGFGHDLLLANEVLDASRLGALSEAGARITVAVDSVETIQAAALGGVPEVLIDVDVGLPRCGCPPESAGRLADTARSLGLTVRGVMGYEGHLMDLTNRTEQAESVAACMELLSQAHNQVGGDVISAGGTGTFDINHVATEIQAGSYLFMDTHYTKVGLPFEEALTVVATVISIHSDGQWAVADAGLKALAMDHGNPGLDTGAVLFCSDEHTTICDGAWSIGDRVSLRPAHVDPTISKHETILVVEDGDVVDQWAVDLRHW
ncbi:MAG: alanine racemase [Acidimicrobiales bacterium]